jgi:hypothetical protein
MHVLASVCHNRPPPNEAVRYRAFYPYRAPDFRIAVLQEVGEPFLKVAELLGGSAYFAHSARLLRNLERLIFSGVMHYVQNVCKRRWLEAKQISHMPQRRRRAERF